MISFWARLVNGKQTKISTLLYRYINNLVNDQNYYSEFHNKIKTILNEIGFSYIWNAQACDETFLKIHLKTVLMDQNKQNWYEQVNNSNKLVKTSLKFETYNYDEIT